MQIETAPGKWALLLDDNLMSAVRVQSQLQRAGFRVKTARAISAEETEPKIVLINLGSRSLDSESLIARSRDQFPAARIAGYCGHKEIEIRKAAKAAGIERIYTNEEAMMELADLV